MSTCFDVKSSAATYSVMIERGQYSALLQSSTADILIADEWFAAELAAAGRKCILVPAKETSKSLDAIPEFVVALRGLGANRETGLIALGGGIVQDVVSFVASVYMRGLKWRYIPSTLLAMADSCIGGKSSINVGPYKNLVGTYHPPETVIIDPILASSLDDEKRIGGLIEAAKICFCRSADSFREYMSYNPGPAFSPGQVEQIVCTSLLAKKWFVEVDEFDKSERLLLNFGHTFGHAIEGASHFDIEHGVGVGLGILCALEMGRLLARDYSRQTNVQIFDRHIRQLLAAVPSLPARISKLSVSSVLECFQADKKHGITSYTVILVAESGMVELCRLPKDSKSLAAIQQALETTFNSFFLQQ